MPHDVMIASAMADRAKAELLAKRLRALKFKVRYDARREHTTPTSRDLNDCNRSSVVLVLWSKAACNTDSPDSDWVHAMAHLARSRPKALMQAGLDATVPDDPFDKDDRFKLGGMGPKKIPNGLYELVDALGTKKKRADLVDWMKLGTRDAEGKQAWKAEHPKDPLALAGKPKKKAAPPQTKAKPAATAAIAAEEATELSPPIGPSAADGAKIKLNPPRTPAPAKTQLAYKRPHPATLHDDTDEIETGWKMLGPILAGIALMMVLAYGLRAQTGPGGNSSMPAIANASLAPAYAETCPQGQVPRSLLETGVLRPGPIVDDTETQPE